MFRFLIDPTYQGLNRPFALLFENKKERKVQAGHYIPKLETK